MGYLVCNKCGRYYQLQNGETPGDFTEECECGGKLRYVESLNNADPNQENKENKINKKGLLKVWKSQSDGIKVLGICLVSIAALFVFLGGAYLVSGNNNSGNLISITNDEIMYADGSNTSFIFTAELTPAKNFNYLQMVTIWYDSSGKVLKRDPITWNINAAQSGKTYKINSKEYLDSAPSKVTILVFDSRSDTSDDSKAIYKKTITFT